MASAVHEMWMGTFTTRDGGGLRANAQRGTCAASDRPLGERQMRHGGLIPTRASSQRPSLWHRRGRPLRGQACGWPVEATRPARLACGFEGVNPNVCLALGNSQSGGECEPSWIITP